MSGVVAAVLCVLAVALLTAASVAVRSVSRIWLRHWVERRLAGASLAELYLERPQRLIVSAGVGVTLSVFLTGAIIATLPAGNGVLATRVAGAAVAIVLLGQVLPRALARRWPARLVPTLIPLLRGVDAAVAPVRWLGAVAARPFVARPLVAPAEEARDSIEELLREGALEGVGATQEIAIIAGVVQFGEKTARDVMTPREQLFALDAATPPEEMARQFAQSGFSRAPVYRGSIDDVVGLVHVFDVFETGGESAPPILPVAFAPPDRPCNELLFAMLRAGRHLAVVRSDGAVDPREGSTLGIVTLEDLLEELVGDIRDEHDEPAPPESPA